MKIVKEDEIIIIFYVIGQMHIKTFRADLIRTLIIVIAFGF